MMTPTQRSLAQLHLDGWPLVAVVEHWNPHANIRQDLFGFIDILAASGRGTLAVQTTSGANVASRLRKILKHPSLPMVLAAGWVVEIHGWKKGPAVKGSKRMVWSLRKIMLTPETVAIHRRRLKLDDPITADLPLEPSHAA